MTRTPQETRWPRIRNAGADALLVSFADSLDDAANRAALAFRRAVDDAGIEGVVETSTTLVSVLLRFDAATADRGKIEAGVESLATSRDWCEAALPGGRKLWTIPAAFGGSVAPQLGEAVAAAGLSEGDALRSLTQSALRVQTIGFAPGQPYLGPLAPEWDIPRQTELTPTVPPGAIAVAIRQLVLFPVASPTGWRLVGRTAFRPFRPEGDTPFVLAAGDEVRFVPVSTDELAGLEIAGPDGGATWERLA